MTYVDERVVELRFDNKQFEQETAKSMSTLDKLKEKLQFKNASAGAEQLQKAVANINVNPIVQGIDAIETKMSAISVAGKRVVENLVDWAMAGVHKVSSALAAPINQIIEGGKKRAQNIEQAKFMLEGLGIAWSDIEADISYGVQDTAYGLDAAAKVASQLVASNVSLGDDMKHALLGISGVAAMTSASYEEIGHIFTTVAAMGKLGGEQIQQFSHRGLNVTAELAKALQMTESEIRELVHKGQIDFNTFSNAMFEAFGTHAKDANKTFVGALSNTKAALSRIGADVEAAGFNALRDILNEIIPKLKEFKKKVKPLEDAIIRITDSIGKLVQAVVKAIDIEKITDAIVPKLERFVDVVNDWVTAYRQVFEGKDSAIRGGTAFIEEQKALGKYTTSIEDATDATIKLTDIKEEQKRLANEIWYEGKHGTGEARKEALGKDYEAVQAYIEEMIALGWDEAAMEEKVTKAAEEEQAAIDNLAKTEKKRKTIVKINAALDNLKTVLKNVGVSIKNIASVVFSSFKDVFSFKSKNSVGTGIVGVTGALARFSEKIKITKDRAEKIRPVFTGFFKVIKGIGTVLLAIGKGLVKIGTFIGDIISKIRNSEIFNRVLNAAKTAIDSIGSAIKTVWDKLKNSGAWDKFVDILKTIGTFLGDVLIKLIEGFGTVGGAVIGGLGDGFSWLKDKIGLVKDKLIEAFPFLGTLGQFIKEDILSGSWISKLGDLFSNLFGQGKDIFEKAYNLGHEFVDGLIKGMNSISLDDIYKGSKIVGFIFAIGSIIKWVNSMANLNDSLSGFTDGISDVCESLVSVLKKYGKKLDAESFSLFADGIIKIVGSIIALTLVMALVPGAKDVAGQAAQIVEVLMAIYAVIFVVKAWMLKTKGAIATVQIKTARLQLAALFVGVGLMVASIAKSVKDSYALITSDTFDMKAFIGALVLTAASIAVVVGVMKSMISQVEDRGGALTVGGLAGLFSGIAFMIYAMSKSIEVISKLMGQEGAHPWQAFGMITLMFIEISTMLGVILAVTKNNTVINNPFKGVMTTFLSIAALMRYGLVPLLEAVDKALRGGDVGTIDAVLIILTVVTALSMALTILVAKSKTQTAFGTAAIFVGIAAAVLAISKAFRDLAKVDTSELIAVATILGTFLVALIAVVGVLSTIAGGGFGLLAVAAVFVAIGVGAYLAAKAFESLLESLETLVKFLGTALTALGHFFEGVVSGIGSLFSKNKIDKSTKKNLDRWTSENKDWLDDQKKIWDSQESAAEEHNAEMNDAFADVSWAKTGNGVDPGKFESWDDYDSYTRLTRNGTLDDITKMAESDAKVEYDTYKTVHEGALAKEQLYNPVKFEIYDTDTAKEKVKQSDETTKALEESAKKLAEADSENINDVVDETVDDWFSSVEFPEVSFGDGPNIDFDKEGLMGQLKNALADMDMQNMGIDAQDAADAMIGSYKDYLGISGLEAGTASFDAFKNGFYDASGNLDYTKITDMFANSGNVNATFSGIGVESIMAIDYGMESKKDVLYSTVQTIPTESVEILRSYYNDWYKAGAYLTEGLSDGVTDKYPRELSEKNMSDVCFNLINKARNVLGEKSPSKKFHKIGEFVTLGMANGILDMSKAAESSTEEVAENSMSALEMILNKIFDTTMAGMDTSPVITPVLDLSQLQEGLYSMSGMLDNNSSFGLAFGAANGYNSVLAARNRALNVNTPYDGTNVVNAISELRSDISSLKDAMGTMGFYVDGRQMATAIADPMNKALNDISVQTGRGVR